MKLSFVDVQRIKERFEKKCLFREPFSAYVNGCCIVPAGEKYRLHILVTLRKPLPPDLVLPEEYQGVKVAIEVVGEILLL